MCRILYTLIYFVTHKVIAVVTVLSMLNIVWAHEAECPKKHLVMVHSSLIHMWLSLDQIPISEIFGSKDTFKFKRFANYLAKRQ